MRVLLPMTLLLVVLTILVYGSLDEMTDVPQAHNFRAVQMGINYPLQSAHYTPVCTLERLEAGSHLCDSTSVPLTVRVQEDDDTWNCKTMGNKLCAWDVVRRYPVRY